jgi:hypothetical protein
MSWVIEISKKIEENNALLSLIEKESMHSEGFHFN